VPIQDPIVETIQKLFEKISDASLIVKGNTYIDCNAAALNLAGYPNKAAFLKIKPGTLSPTYQANGQLSSEKAEEMIAKALSKGTQSFAWRLLRYDNTTVDIDVTLTRFTVGTENYLHFIWHDSSSYVIKRQTESMNQFIEKMGDAHLILKNGVYIECNQAAVDLLGYPNKESILQLGREHFYPKFQPDGQESEKKALEMIQKTRVDGSYAFEWTYKKSDGSPLPAMLMMTFSIVNDEEILHLVWRDISPQLEAQSDSIKELLGRMGDASLLIKDNMYVDCNQAAADILGYPSREALLNIHPIKISPKTQPDGRDSIEKANEVMAKGYDESSSYFEWTHLKYDGTPILIEVLLTPVRIHNEDMIHVIWRDITEKKKAQEQINKLAYEDDLTGLANRRTLVEQLQHVLILYRRTHYIGALLFIDLDYFKNINDTMGHNAGDELLRQVSKRLNSAARIGDTVSRFGGDEFVIMLEELDKDPIHAAKKAELACEKILSELSIPYQLKNKEVVISASIGVSMFSEGSLVKDLLRQSDIAMYQAKSAGRNRARFFDPLMQKAIDERVDTENRLNKALEKDQFELHYQPQVNENNKPLGVEALLRLKDPERGYIPPMEYIPIAEETGIIIHIGRWVLDTACQQLKSWETNPLTANLSIAINVSPLEFKEDAFILNVLRAIRRNNINPSLLKLELTETMLVDNVDGVISTMNILKENGVQFSMDDFGTGYSSLQYLRQLPLNQLKIDQSFVRDLEHDEQDRSIVKTIIAMGNGLGLDVIAEGVENTQQKDILFGYGCSSYQGYLFAKPLPIAKLEEQLLAELENH